MSDPIALTQATYDKFNRAASVIRGGVLTDHTTNVPGDEFEVLKVASSTIGTYGYPANFQIFDPSAGTWSNDSNRPQTVYLIDPAGGAWTSGQYADARFLCYRGTANSSVYEAVKQSGSSTDFTDAFRDITSTVVGTGAGLGAAASWGANSSGYQGSITVTTAVAGVPSGPIVTVSWAPAYTTAPGGVVISPANQPTAALNGNQQVFVSSVGTNNFVITAGTTAFGGFLGLFKWNYIILSN